MEAEDIDAVIDFVRRWNRRNRGERLTWGDLEKHTGLTRQWLAKQPPIYRAYQKARSGTCKRAEAGEGGDQSGELRATITRLQATIEDLKGERSNLLAMLERWQHNAKLQGWSLTLLEREIPKPLHRTLPPAARPAR
jgi:hypothetical protein